MLMLLRHAKSSWERPERDFDRPLGPRGLRDAPRMARDLAAQGFAPTHVLCSPARRTRETLALLQPHWPLPKATFPDDLYESTAETVRARIDRDGGARTLVIGHNPGLHDVARMLVSTAEDRDRLRTFPTCAFAAIDRKTGRLLAFRIPKTLTV